MSQRNRIIFAAVALAALCLAAPAPSHAAGLRQDRVPVAGVVERLWSWLTSLLLNAGVREPTTPWEKEGGMINPNGLPSTTTAPAVPGQGISEQTTPGEKEGSAINPNGLPSMTAAPA